MEHPYDHRDFQLFLQNLPVQAPMYTAFKQSRSYCLCVAEIETIRVLCGCLIVILQHQIGSETTQDLNIKHSDLDSYFNIITAGFSAEQQKHQEVY